MKTMVMRGRTGQTHSFPAKMARYEDFRKKSGIGHYRKIISKRFQQSAIRFEKYRSNGSMSLFSLKSSKIIKMVG